MLAGGHQFSKNIIALLRKNQQQYPMCHVQRFNQENLEFDVQEAVSPHL